MTFAQDYHVAAPGDRWAAALAAVGLTVERALDRGGYWLSDGEGRAYVDFVRIAPSALESELVAAVESLPSRKRAAAAQVERAAHRDIEIHPVAV